MVAGILRWNFPFFLIARKAGAALIAGCTIVIKPSQITPENCTEFAKILDDIQLPAGVINIVTGRGSVIGNEMAGSPKIDLVSVTGSVGAGESIMQAAAKNITKVSLELGGKEFTELLLKKFEQVRVGDPCADHSVDMGPLVEARALESVTAKVENAIKQGAKVLCGGHRLGDKGYFYAPTLLDNCTQDMDIIHEETFGPVLPIVEFEDIDQVIAWANDVEYGLASSVFTKDIDTAAKVARSLEFGETYINREHFEAMQGFHAGVKKSGIGGADGKHGVEEYLSTHVTYLATH